MYSRGRLSCGITRQMWLDAGHGDDTPSAAPCHHVQCSQDPWPLERTLSVSNLKVRKRIFRFSLQNFIVSFAQKIVCLGSERYQSAARCTACLMNPLIQKFACKKLQNQLLTDDGREV